MAAMDSDSVIDAIFSRREEITIVAVGSPDFAGNASVELSNGTFARSRYPIVGRTFEVITHAPKKERLEGSHLFRVTPWKEAPIELSIEDILRMAGFKAKHELEGE